MINFLMRQKANEACFLKNYLSSWIHTLQPLCTRHERNQRQAEKFKISNNTHLNVPRNFRLEVSEGVVNEREFCKWKCFLKKWVMRQLFNIDHLGRPLSLSLYLSYNTSASSVIRRCGINLIKLVYQMKFALIRASTQKPNDKEKAAANDFLINNA